MFFGRNNEKFELKAHHKKLMQNLTIDDTHPGTLLHDFQVMLDVFSEKDHKLTAKHQLPLNVIREINPRLSRPIDVRLKRMQQSSYPHIEGLYLLLRASGFAGIAETGKTTRLVLVQDWLEQWASFNPTEKYCHLLESWLIRGYDEIINGRSNSFGSARTIENLMYGFTKIPENGDFKIKSYKHFKQEFSYYPTTYHLALMDLFGIVKIYEGKPLDGDGWQVDKIKRTKFGQALVTVLFDLMFNQMPGLMMGYVEKEENEDDEQNEEGRSFSILQPILKEYFPAWEKTIEVPKIEAMTGKYTFKVSLGKQWSAIISLDSTETFDSFARTILRAVGFDNDHLYEFRYKSRFGTEVAISHPYSQEMYSTSELTIGYPHFKPGKSMTFIFDFGDWWEFDILVEAHNPDDTGAKVEIVSTTGEAPEQYPDWDDDDDDYDDDFESFATGFDFD